MTDNLRQIVIAGGGTAGWIAAAMLARFVPRTTKITLVESEAIGTVGVGEATIPQIRFLTGGLGIDEDAFLAATQGTIKLGIEFVDWLRPGHRYMHAFGQVGRGQGVTPFHHHWLRGRALGIADDLGAYKLTEVAARSGRFARPPAAPPTLAYAFHFDATLVARFLRSVAERAGVTRVEGRITGVERAQNGDVSALRLEGERRVEGDFFLDCSGFRSLLLGETLCVGFEDWTRWLPCDRAMAVPSASVGDPVPYTSATAREAGWQWRIPLQHRTGNGYVYSSAHLSDDEAAATLLAKLDGEALDDPRPIAFTAGKRERFWERNVVALGLASGFMEPLESTSIHMVQSAVARLLTLFPQRQDDAAARDAYNRQTHAEFDHIRDFLVLHYHATERDGAFWQACREAPLPEALAEKLCQFRAGGRILAEDEGLFTEPGWLQVMVGQGIQPEAWSPLAEAGSPAELASFLQAIRDSTADQAARLPSHADFIARHCRATAHRPGLAA
jgi:tryptophan halogenase